MEKSQHASIEWDTGFTRGIVRPSLGNLGAVDSRAWILAAALIAIFTLWYIYTTFIYHDYISELRHVPMVRSYIPWIRRGPSQFSQDRGDIFYRMNKDIPNEGLIRFQGFLDREHIFLTSPQAVYEVLVQRSYDFIKPPPGKRVFDTFLGTTFLLVTEGAAHRQMKSIMQAPFSLRKIRGLYSLMWSRAILMTETKGLSAERNDCGHLLAELDEWAHEATLDVIIRAVFGDYFGQAENKASLPALKDIVVSPTWDVQLYFTMSAFLPHWALRFVPGGIDSHFRSASRRLRQAVTDLVELRRESPRGDDSDILIQIMERDALDDEDLVGHILGLLMAGVDPTTASFTWTIWYLANDTYWQDRLRQEIQANIPFEHFQQDTSKLDLIKILEDLPILDAVCSEALRLRPPSPTSNRVTTRDTTIMGYPIRAGTKLFLSSYVNNRAEEYWGPSADSFDPGRWLGERKQQQAYGRAKGPAIASHFAFMPFGHGPRKCIGHIYAQAEIRVFVITLVGKYHLQMAERSEKVEPAGVLTSKPKHGLKLRLRPVEPWKNNAANEAVRVATQYT